MSSSPKNPARLAVGEKVEGPEAVERALQAAKPSDLIRLVDHGGWSRADRSGWTQEYNESFLSELRDPGHEGEPPIENEPRVRELRVKEERVAPPGNPVFICTINRERWSLNALHAFSAERIR